MPELPPSLPPESEGRSVFPPPEELLDEYPKDPEVEISDSAMSKWDTFYQKRVEALAPELLPPEKVTELAQVIQLGRRAAEELERAGFDSTESDALLARAAEGQAARDELVVGNLRLASWFTREIMDFNKQSRLEKGKSIRPGRIVPDLSALAGGEMDYSDMMQVATMGLMRAAERHDPAKGKFAGYAMFYMEVELMNEVTTDQSPLNIPDYLGPQLAKLASFRNEMTDETGRIPELPELAKHLKWDLERTAFISDLAASKQPISFEHLSEHIRLQETERIGQPGEEEELIEVPDRLPDPTAEYSLADQAALSELGSRVDRLLSVLPERDRRILELRFGFESGEQMAYADVGKALTPNLTGARIQQIVTAALALIRQDEGVSRELSDFTEKKEDPSAGIRAELKLSAEDDVALNISRPKPRDFFWISDRKYGNFELQDRVYNLSNFQKH